MSKSAILRHAACAIVLTKDDPIHVLTVSKKPGIRGVQLAELEFPGGKCEPDEKRDAAALRELKEEVGVDGSRAQLVYAGVNVPTKSGGEVFMVSAYLIRAISGAIRAEDGLDVGYYSIEEFERRGRFPTYFDGTMRALRAMGYIPHRDARDADERALMESRAYRHECEMIAGSTYYGGQSWDDQQWPELCTCAERFGVEFALESACEITTPPGTPPGSAAVAMWLRMGLKPQMLTALQRKTMLLAFSAGLTRGIEERKATAAYEQAERVRVRGGGA